MCAKNYDATHKTDYVKYGYIVVKRSSFFEIWGGGGGGGGKSPSPLPPPTPLHSTIVRQATHGLLKFCYNTFCFNFRVSYKPNHNNSVLK